MGPRRGERVAIVDGDADSAQVAAFERDRRELIRRGLGVGGAVVAASSIPLLWSVRNAFAFGEADKSLLADAIRVERIAVLAYDRLLAGRLSARVMRLARQLRSHEQQHANALQIAFTELRAPLPPQPGAKDIDDVARGIGDVMSEGAAINFAIELETALVGAYHDALAKLYDAKLLQLAATITASEGQHLVLLRRAAHKPVVPNALERGSSA